MTTSPFKISSVLLKMGQPAKIYPILFNLSTPYSSKNCNRIVQTKTYRHYALVFGDFIFNEIIICKAMLSRFVIS